MNKLILSCRRIIKWVRSYSEDDSGPGKNTLVVFMSDNGTSGPASNMPELKEMGHFASWILRGSKADIWDGGHLVTFLVHLRLFSLLFPGFYYL